MHASLYGGQVSESVKLWVLASTLGQGDVEIMGMSVKFFEQIMHCGDLTYSTASECVYVSSVVRRA